MPTPVTAIPESTFVSEYYLRHRGCAPPARVVRLDEVERELRPGDFDLAVNVHSFSECPLAAIEWWVAQLARLEVPRLLVIPNEPDGLLSLEADGRREDFVKKAVAAGAVTFKEPMDYGLMYGHGFQDLDGHLWELAYMDVSAMPKA